MRAIGQITIINLCDVVTSDTPPENPYVGQLWVDTNPTPPETKVWNGSEWVPENNLEELRRTVETNTSRCAEFEQTAEGLNSYVAGLTETVESVTGGLEEEQRRVLEAEKRLSELEQTMDSFSLRFQEEYIGGMNYVQNSAGLNGLTDEWTYTGTVTTDSSTDTQNNTASDSAFVLGATSTLRQTITGMVTGRTYTLSLRAKKTYSGYSGYAYAKYNGSKTAYLFNTTSTFSWTDYSVTLEDVSDSTIQIYIYSREASLYVSDIMLTEGATVHKWTQAPNEIYTEEVKIDRRGIEVSNSKSSQRTVITNTEFSGYYNNEKIFTLNKDETQTKKTTVDGELTVGKTKFVPMPTASQGLNIVILD